MTAQSFLKAVYYLRLKLGKCIFLHVGWAKYYIRDDPSFNLVLLFYIMCWQFLLPLLDAQVYFRWCELYGACRHRGSRLGHRPLVGLGWRRAKLELCLATPTYAAAVAAALIFLREEKSSFVWLRIDRKHGRGDRAMSQKVVDSMPSPSCSSL